jgi:hypothetical protein
VKRHRAVDAAAHRNRDPAGVGRRAEDLSEGIRHRVGGERLAWYRCGLEQRQALQRPRHPGRVRVQDAIAVDDQARERPLATASRIAHHFECHATQARA